MSDTQNFTTLLESHFAGGQLRLGFHCHDDDDFYAQRGRVECIIAARRGTASDIMAPDLSRTAGQVLQTDASRPKRAVQSIETIWFLSITATVAPGRFQDGRVMTESAVNRPIDR